ncbi:MAG TPA: polysaccharide deacetylase family protein [Bryobacteraceae bacterium]|nr:polysaccharide deacetylase family protein [Bryobacteraceae bacterium]
MRCLIFLFALSCFAADRQVAITIDDLPRGGDHGGPDFESIRAMTLKLLKPFRDGKIPLTAFVNSGRQGLNLTPAETRKLLDLWLDAGANLGNHTFSHPSLNTTPVGEYEADIVKGEQILRDALAARGQQLEFFRYPFLQTGATAESKQAVAEFLAKRGYRIAPVTYDDDDYDFARCYTDPALRARVDREFLPYLEAVIAFFEVRSKEVTGREIPQILLLHANQMNADTMPRTIAMLKRRGYQFISLDEALKDKAYNLPDNYVGTGGFSLIHRWAKTKGLKFKTYEPEEPPWVTDYLKQHR